MVRLGPGLPGITFGNSIPNSEITARAIVRALNTNAQPSERLACMAMAASQQTAAASTGIQVQSLSVNANCGPYQEGHSEHRGHDPGAHADLVGLVADRSMGLQR